MYVYLIQIPQYLIREHWLGSTKYQSEKAKGTMENECQLVWSTKFPPPPHPLNSTAAFVSGRSRKVVSRVPARIDRVRIASTTDFEKYGSLEKKG